MSGERKQIDGFKKWDSYYQFAKDKYTDVSVAIVSKDFELFKSTMRELIDNTCPYHSKGVNITYIENNETLTKKISYDEYFELIIEKLEEIKIQENSDNLTPDQMIDIANGKNLFFQETRKIRRLIMDDISTAGIIPTAEIKKDPKINKLLTGDSDEN